MQTLQSICLSCLILTDSLSPPTHPSPFEDRQSAQSAILIMLVKFLRRLAFTSYASDVLFGGYYYYETI
jgi:hypothetical protein